jgi:hypothetical protein
MMSHFRKFWSETSSTVKRAIIFRILEEAHSIRVAEIEKAFKDCPEKLEDFYKTQSIVKRSTMDLTKDLLAADPKVSDFFFGFHAMPQASVGHLHMHVVLAPAQFRRYSTYNNDEKTIPAEAVIEVIDAEKNARPQHYGPGFRRV